MDHLVKVTRVTKSYRALTVNEYFVTVKNYSFSSNT